MADKSNLQVTAGTEVPSEFSCQVLSADVSFEGSGHRVGGVAKKAIAPHYGRAARACLCTSATIVLYGVITALTRATQTLTVEAG